MELLVIHCRIHCVYTHLLLSALCFCPNNSIQPFMCLDVVSSASVLLHVQWWKKKQKLSSGSLSLVNSFYIDFVVNPYVYYRERERERERE